MHPIITIDGPSGAGKGTIAVLIAKKLGWNLLDSGLIYRALTYIALENNIELSKNKQLVDLAKTMEVTFSANSANLTVEVIYKGKSIEPLLRTENIGMHTSKVAAVSEVRQALIKRQRDFIAPPGLVADGRDMGTFIFPEANIKFFITASIEERAKRRYKQLQKNNINVNINDLFLQISNRDKSDAEREDSPLRQASDAIYIDTTDLTIDEVVSEAFAVIKSKGLSA